jgi:hypothetical protein
VEKHEKHKIEAAGSRRRKIRGGIAFGCLSSFTNNSSFLSTMRGAVIHPWTMMCLV